MRYLWAVVVLLASCVAPVNAHAQRLGLHVTQGELDIWQQRSQHGPYKRPGDVRQNSPGDWERILANANSFRGNPKQERYTGGNMTTASSGCVINTKGTSGPTLDQGTKLRDAAFAFLVTQDRSYRDAVARELLAQVSERGVDFANTAKWNHQSGCLTGVVDPTFELANWATRLLFGYDYIKSTLSSGERQTIERWFLNAGRFFDWYHLNATAKRFPDRDRDDYRTSPFARGPCSNTSLYYGGPCRYRWHNAWNNLVLLATRFSGLVGVAFDDAALKAHAKRFVQEWFAYMIWRDGSQGELDRWRDGRTERGFGYWAGAMGNAIVLADAFCRAGDCALFTYETGAGMYGTEGGQKGLLSVIRRYLEYRDGTVRRYATNSSAGRTEATRIDGVDGTWQHIGDVSNVTLANLYYKDAYLKSHYLRTRPGLPDYPRRLAGGQGWWGGQDNLFPGILFMWGGLDGKVWPYPKAGPSPPAPTGLHGRDHTP
jgi:hypothetical protein